MAGQAQVLEFIGSAFQSVWALEVLRLLAQAPEGGLSEDKMIAALRASKGAIGQSVASLARAGLVIVDRNVARFQPASAELEQLALEAIELYGRRPDLVRRTIVSCRSPGIAAFADAFKFRKDR